MVGPLALGAGTRSTRRHRTVCGLLDIRRSTAQHDNVVLRYAVT